MSTLRRAALPRAALLVLLLLGASVPHVAHANGSGMYFGAGTDADPNLSGDTTIAASGDTVPVTIKEYASLTLNGHVLTSTDATTIIRVQGTLSCGSGGKIVAGNPANGLSPPAAQGNQGRGGAGGTAAGSVLVAAKKVTGTCTIQADGASGSPGTDGGAPGVATSGTAGTSSGTSSRLYTSSSTGTVSQAGGGASTGAGGAGASYSASVWTAQRFKLSAPLLLPVPGEWQFYGRGGASGANGGTNNVGTGGGGGGAGAGGGFDADGGAGASGGTATGSSTGGGGGGGGGPGALADLFTEDDAGATLTLTAKGGDGGAAGNANAAAGGQGGRGGGGNGGWALYMGPQSYASLTLTVTGGAAGAAATTGVAGASGNAGAAGISKNILDQPYETQADAQATYEGQPHANQSFASGGRIYYFEPSVASDVPGYGLATQNPPTTPESTVSAGLTGTSFQLFASFATIPGDPSIGALPSGTFSRDVYAKVSNGAAILKVETYKRTSGGVETLLHQGTSSVFSDMTPTLQHWQATDSSAYAFDLTDRMVWKLYAARSSGPSTVTVTTYFEDSAHASSIQTTVGSNIATSVCQRNSDPDYGCVGNRYGNASLGGGDPLWTSSADVDLGSAANVTIHATYDNKTARTGAANNITISIRGPTGAWVVDRQHPTEDALPDGSSQGYYYLAFTPSTEGTYRVFVNSTTSTGEWRSAPGALFRARPYGATQDNVNATSADVKGAVQYGNTIANDTNQKLSYFGTAVLGEINASWATLNGTLTLSTFNAWNVGEYRPAVVTLNGALSAAEFRDWKVGEFRPVALTVNGTAREATVVYFGSGIFGVVNQTLALVQNVNNSASGYLTYATFHAFEAGKFDPASARINGTLNASDFWQWHGNEFEPAAQTLDGTAREGTVEAFGDQTIGAVGAVHDDVHELKERSWTRDAKTLAMRAAPHALILIPILLAGLVLVVLALVLRRRGPRRAALRTSLLLGGVILLAGYAYANGIVP